MTTINQYAFDAIIGFDGSAATDGWEDMSREDLIDAAEAQAEYYDEPTDYGAEKLDSAMVADAVLEAKGADDNETRQIRSGLDLENKFLASAENRETSDEIMNAIWRVAGCDYRSAVSLWEHGPDSAQLASIVEITTGNGRDGKPEDYFWGAAGNDWAN